MLLRAYISIFQYDLGGRGCRSAVILSHYRSNEIIDFRRDENLSCEEKMIRVDYKSLRNLMTVSQRSTRKIITAL